jgi:hypothetical protein
MFKEFAIDPSLMTDWDAFKELRDKFGVFQGRFIADFPHKEWKKAVANLLEERSQGSHPVRNSATIMAWLQSSDGRRDLRFMRKARQYDKNKAWIGNAEAQSHTFDGLVTGTETTAENSIQWHETLCLSAHPKFEVNTQPQISRRSDELLEVIQPLLRISTKVLWVDRYLSTDGFQLETVIDCLAWLRDIEAIKSLEIHLGIKERDELNIHAQRENYRRKLDGLIPDHLKVSLHWWSQSEIENIHPRFVLTDAGGLHFDHGTDPGLGTSIVHLMNRVLWEGALRRYHRDTSDLSFRGTIIL